mgnify:CR=1 FL=1
MAAASPVPLVAHVVHALRVGGLENGLVNLINRMPPDRYRHAIVCLTDYDRFRERLDRPEAVEVLALGKREGKDPLAYARLWRLLRRLRPDIVHTRNLATLEAQVCAWLAGVGVRIHGEHGRDMVDLDGSHARYRLMRRLCRPLIQRHVALSQELADYLSDAVGVSRRRIARIGNGVDLRRFRPDGNDRARRRAELGWGPGDTVIGWVGRMEAVKAPIDLARAYGALVRRLEGDGERRVVLAMIGHGGLEKAVHAELERSGVADRAWLPGSRDDLAGLYRAMDLFVLPSLAEGISNTILEAMASGLPVVATRVGGNAELVTADETGTLVPPGDPGALASALERYVREPGLMRAHGEAARRRAERAFGIDTMVSAYLALYDDALAARRSAGAAAGAGTELR